MKSSKDINLDTYNLSLITAKEDVLNPRTSTNWALFAYDGVTNRLKLADSGAGGVSELVHKLHPRRPFYGLCRVDQPKTAQTHFVMIIWVGKEVDDYRRAQCVAHVPSIKSFFKEVHFFLPASSLDDVTEERIFTVASTVIAMIDREKSRRVVRKVDREETVGTNYKRTIAAAEIHKTLRENFWAQAEREEEARKDEERRRAAEDRRRRERERVQQERRETEERERMMNEKLKKIQQQRQLQAEADAEKLKQEKLKWAQQQKEFEEEMRFRFTHSESVEKAAEAAVLVSQRKQNPREFFRQLSMFSFSDTHPNPPSPSSPVRSSNRRIHRSLTDAFIFTKSSSSSPSSPCSPKPLSPFFPSSPTSHSPTALSQPQHTHSSPTAIPPSVPAGILTKGVGSLLPPSGPGEIFPSYSKDQTVVSTSAPSGPSEVFPSHPSGPTVGSLSPPRAQRVISPLPPSGVRDIFPFSTSGPRDIFPLLSSGPRDVVPSPLGGPREVFASPSSSPSPPSGPTMGSVSPPRAQKVVSPLPPSVPRDVFPLPLSGPRDISPSPLGGPKEVFPSAPSGPSEVFQSPPSGPTVGSLSPPRVQKVVSPFPPSDPRDVFPSPLGGPREVFPSFPSGPTLGSLSPPRAQKVVSPSPPSGTTVGCLSPLQGQKLVSPLPPSNQTVPECLYELHPSYPPHTPSPAAPSTSSSTCLQPCSPVNPDISLTEIVQGLTFYPPSQQSTANTTIQSLVQPESEISAPPQAHITSLADQNSVCHLNLTNNQVSSPAQLHPEMSTAVSIPLMPSGQPVPRPPSRPLPSLPAREFCSLEDFISTEEEMKERKDGEVTGEKEAWVNAQASMISIPEEEDDNNADKRRLEEEEQLRVDRDVREGMEVGKSREKEGVMGKEEEKQEKGHGKVQREKDGQMVPPSEKKNEGTEAKNVESKMVGVRDEGMKEETEKLDKKDNNPEHWIATQVSIDDEKKDSKIEINERNELGEEAPEVGGELTEKKDDGREREEHKETEQELTLGSIDVEAKDESKHPKENEAGREKINSEILNKTKDRNEEAPAEGRKLIEKKDDEKEGDRQEEKKQGEMGREEEKQKKMQSEKEGQILPPSEEKNKSMEAGNLEIKMVGEKQEKKENDPEHWTVTQASMISVLKVESIDGEAKNDNKDLKENEVRNEKDIKTLNKSKESDEEAQEEGGELTDKKDDGKEENSQEEKKQGLMGREEEQLEKMQSEKEGQMLPPSEEKNIGMEAENLEMKMIGERDEGLKEVKEKLEKKGNDPEHWTVTQSLKVESVDGEANYENKDLKENEVRSEKKDIETLNKSKEGDEEAHEEGEELTEKKNDEKEGQERNMELEEEKQEKMRLEMEDQILPPSVETNKGMEAENLESKMVRERDEGIKEMEEELEKTESDTEHWVATQASMISILKEESIICAAKNENKGLKENESGGEKKDSEILNERKDRDAPKEERELREKKVDGNEEKQEKVRGERNREMVVSSKVENKDMEAKNVERKMVRERDEGMKEEEEKLEKTREEGNNPEHWIATQASMISIPEKESAGGEAKDTNKHPMENEAGKERIEEAVEGRNQGEGQKGKEQGDNIKSLSAQEKPGHLGVAEVEKVKADEEHRTMGEENSASKEGNKGGDEEKERKEESDRKSDGLKDIGIETEVEKDAERGAEGATVDEVKNEVKNLVKNEEKIVGLHENETEAKVNEDRQMEQQEEEGKTREEGDVNGESDTDWKETCEVENTEPTDGEEGERMENKVESQRKSESLGNWENGENAGELAEFERSVEQEINQGSTPREEQHRDEVKVVECLGDGDTLNETKPEMLIIAADPTDQKCPHNHLQTAQELEDPIPGVSCQEHVMNTSNEETSEEFTPADTNYVQSENLSSGNCLTNEVESNPSVSDDQPDSLPICLAENMVAAILESLASSIESSVTESTVFKETCQASPSRSSREFEDSSVDEAHETEEVCEAAKGMKEVEIEGESAESETDELDCEPAEWHTAELKTRHISTDSIKQLGPEDVGDELEDTDYTTSTYSNQLTSSLDPVPVVSDVDDGQEAFTLSADDKASYEKAQEPDYDSGSVEEATERAFLPAIDVNLKVMDTVTVSDIENKVKGK